MGKRPIDTKDSLYPQGRVEVFTSIGKPTLVKTDTDILLDFSQCRLIGVQDLKNIVLNFGKDYVLRGLAESYTPMRITRMAIGDRGTIPSDSTVPKVPVSTMTGLYNEVFRADVEGFILNVGTPTVHEVKFVKTFSAASIPITAFSNQAKPVVNEVGLIMTNPAASPPIPSSPRPDDTGPYFFPDDLPYPYPPVSPYNYPPTDEIMFSIRTYKSVPFEAKNDISVTIRYTIYVE